MHLDADAFFASVEQRDKPSLAGKPVLVGGVGPRGVVATASYEARRAGARSAMPMWQARKLCPQAAVLVPRFAAYSAYSALIMDVLHDLTPAVQPLSIDEAFADLDAADPPVTDALASAQSARARIRDLSGLSVSVGLGRSKLIAKLASDAAKPDGALVVNPSEEEAFLLPLPVRALWGVGPASADRLVGIGVRTVADLARQPLDTLVLAVGESAGANLYRLARGIDTRPVEEPAERKSAGAERTFPSDMHGRDTVVSALGPVTDAALARLARHGGAARSVVVKVRYADFTTVTRSVTLPFPTAQESELHDAALRALAQAEVTAPVRLLGVSFHGLSDHAQPMLPFDDELDTPTLLDGMSLETPAGQQGLAGATAPVPVTPHNVAPGVDVAHPVNGRGWVVAVRPALVAVRFESALTGPGPQRVFTGTALSELVLAEPVGPVPLDVTSR